MLRVGLVALRLWLVVLRGELVVMRAVMIVVRWRMIALGNGMIVVRWSLDAGKQSGFNLPLFALNAFDKLGGGTRHYA
ncbi:hypothetical protein ABE073_16980 [Lederbergia citrisecunda]|uniref:hypothetical protein n=1 Tax=Lederbergia citrisecunda TaxID=2833583 RepID=UPI003D284A42